MTVYPILAALLLTAIPTDVSIPPGFTGLTIDYFDDFSWKSFIALENDFQNYHPAWEVFHEDGSAPSTDAKYNGCSAKVSAGDIVLSDVAQAGDGALLPPLVAQNGRYVMYLEAYNDTAYGHIVTNKWYLRDHLPVVPVPRPALPPVQFPFGSIAVKSAWVPMKGFTQEQQKRFYTRTALVRDPNTGKCGQETVGLLGLHIIQKTPSRPQWIWSSFEQVDIVPPAEPGSTGVFTLHDGTETPMPAQNPLPLNPLAPAPVTPFNVVRSTKFPIHPQTVATNERYRKQLAGTVWSNYQLAVTQWPLAPRRPVEARSRKPGRRHLRNLPRRRSHFSLRQHVHGTLRPVPPRSGLHELPQPRPPSGRFHVVCCRTRLSGEARDPATIPIAASANALIPA